MMNKLLQHIMDAGGGTNKFLPYLQQFQTKGQYNGKNPLFQLISNPRTPVYSSITNPATLREQAKNKAAATEQIAFNKMLDKQGQIKPAGPKRSAASKAWAIATNPVTAASYAVQGRPIPENFERGERNMFDMAVDVMNPAAYLNAAKQATEGVGRVVQSPSTVMDELPGIGLNLLASVPLAGEAIMFKDFASPIVKQTARTFKSTADLPLAKRIVNAANAGALEARVAGDIPGHAFFNMSADDVGNRIAEEIKTLPKGAYTVDKSLSKNSAPLFWNYSARTKPNEFTLVRTGETQPLNWSGTHGRRVNSALPLNALPAIPEIDDITKAVNSRIQYLQSLNDPSLAGQISRLQKEGVSSAIIGELDLLAHKNPKAQDLLLEFMNNYKPYLDKPIMEVNQRTGLNFPLTTINKSENAFYNTYRYNQPTIYAVKGNPLKDRLIPALKQYAKDRTERYYFGDLFKSKPGSQLPDPPEYISLDSFEEGGENPEYKGSSIVDYLATKGYSGKKTFRKGLAEQYGVQDYDFSANKNLELLAKLRENDDLLQAYEQNFEPVPVERLQPQVNTAAIQQAIEQEREAEKRKSFNNLRNRLTLQMGFDPFLQGPKAPKINVANPSLIGQRYPKNSFVHAFQTTGSSQPPAPAPKPVAQKPVVNPPVVEKTPGEFRFDTAPVPDPSAFFPFNRFPAYPERPVTKQVSDIPNKTTAKQAAKNLEADVNDKAWYEQAWEGLTKAIKDSQLDWRSMNMSPSGVSPEGAKVITRDVTKNILGAVSEDLAQKYQNKMERQDAKLNPNERKSKLDPAKVMFDPVYVTGDTIPDNERRYHIPEVMDLDYMRFGVRNRGDLKPIKTEGAPITAFDPFQSSKQYFAKSTDPANATYIGIAPDGRVKVGGKEQFQDADYQITRTFGNKVIDFNRDPKGSIVKVPSNPKASKETLSPSVKVLGDDGKVVDGRLSLLLPPKGNQEESYDLVTGGRYIFQTPDGKTKLVSGSLKNIEAEFYKMKKNNPYVNVITLDNGSYARGIRTFDQKLTRQDLKGYDNQNSAGGNFAYILPGDRKTRYDSKFSDFEAEVTRRLQAKYPGKKVSVGYQNEGLYDQTGGRDIQSQIAIQKKGNSQTPVSLHNFGAAKDYVLYVDGKPLDADKNKKLYKDVLWGSADKTGLYHLEDWDPTHISLAKEGQKTAFDELYAKYPDIFANPNFAKSLAYLNANKNNPLYEEYVELLNNIQPFTGKPRTTEVMKRNMAKKKSGGPIVDPRGQWAHPGKETMVPTPNGQITMQGVPYPVYGQDETGYGQMMYPGGEYSFPGQMVYETPMSSGLPSYQIRGQVIPRATIDNTRVAPSDMAFFSDQGYQYAQSQFKKAKEFHENWMNSPMYNRMIQKSDPAQAEEITKRRKKNMEGIKFKYVPVQPKDRPRSGGYSNSGTGDVTILPRGVNVHGMGTHELSHSIDRPVKRGNLLQDFKNLIFNNDDESVEESRLMPDNDISTISKMAGKNQSMYTKQYDTEEDKEWFDYVTTPTETRARLNDIRQSAYENGLYNPFEEKVTPAIYNKLKNYQFEKSNKRGFDPMRQLRGVYFDQQIIDLLNSVSKTGRPSNAAENNMMSKGGQHGGLDRWFAEKWVDIKTGKDCGRQEGESRKGYPACRPSKRVSSKTPKTASELSSSEREKFKRSKTSSERINYNHKRK